MIDDAIPVQQGLPSFISQLDMPVPDGVMDNAAATEDETSNNASVNRRLDSTQASYLPFAERWVREPVFCSDGINLLADVLLPVIFNTRHDDLHDAYEGIIIENPWLVNKLFDAYKYHKIRRLGVYGSHDHPSAGTNVIAGHSCLPSHRE